MNSAANLLDIRRGELIERWKRRVRSELVPCRLSDGELVDHLPLVLDELSSALRADYRESRDHSRVKQLAQMHGRQRFRKGFDLRRLVQEFGLLRDCVIDLFEEGGMTTFGSIVLTNRFITMAVTESVAQFVDERDSELKERAQFEEQIIGIVSHDLRDPLGAIQIAATTLLQTSGLSELHTRTVSRIRSSSDRALRLIADLLDFSSTRFGGGLAIERTSFDLHQLVREIVEEVALGAEKRELHVEAVGDGRGQWDESRVAQVVTNLVNNALVYSPEASAIRIKTSGEEDELVLAVHNEGAPIPVDAQARLFKPMVRGARVSAKSSRSIGLGLYIVDQIARAHAGRVQVQSTAEAGTTFTVVLPRHPPAQ